MGCWVEELRVPLVSGVAEHQSLVTCTKVVVGSGLKSVHGITNFGGLSLDVGDHIAGGRVKTHFLMVEANFLGDVSGDLLEVDFFFSNTSLTEEYDLQ